MKTSSFLLLCLLAAGCNTLPVQHHTAPVAAPSLAGIQQRVNDASASTQRAKGHAANIGTNAATLRSNAQRVDDKAVLVLEFLKVH